MAAHDVSDPLFDDTDSLWTDEELVDLMSYRPVESGKAYVALVEQADLSVWSIPEMADPVAYIRALRQASRARRETTHWRID